MTTPPIPPKTRAPVLPRQPAASASAALGAGPAAIEELRGELQAWFDLSPCGQLVFDEPGVVLRHNAALAQMLGGAPPPLREAAPELRELLGFPTELPAVAATRVREGWLARPGGQPLPVRVRVRGVPANGGGRLPGSAAVRWIAMFEDREVEDERDIARVEIQALMGTAGIGVATWDAARGWVGSVQRGARAGGGAAGASADPAEPRQGSLMAVGRDLVEPESMAEYERLQAALRHRTRIEVRYAVRHHESGRRWLMTRVEPAELGPQRGAFSVVTVDVTEEETARRRNHDLLTELSTILDVSPAGIAYLRGDQLVRCNRRFESLLHGAADAPGASNGRSFETLLRDAGVAAEAVEQVLRAVRETGALETELLLPAGPRRPAPTWCSLALRRTHETTPGAVGLVVVLADATRLKSQQAELEALSRERELMFNLSDVGIVYQRDGHVERANQAMADLLGVAPQALKGLPMAALYESEAAWRHYQQLEAHDMATLGRSHGERRVRRRDGELFWAQVSQRPVAFDRPAAGTILSFVNIDDRQRARESLVQQADRTRAILDSVLVGIVTVGDAGIEWMNRSARRMFGGELADFVGAPISVVATDELDHPLRRTDYGETLEEGQAATFECRLRARDGRNFWVVGNVVVTGQDTAHRQLTYALLDIERRRQAEVSIVQARASLQRIIETAPLAIALFDAASQQVVQLNQMAATFAGRPMHEIVGRVPSQWLPGPEGAKLAADLQRALASPDAVQRELRREAEAGIAGSEPRVWDIRIVSLRSSADAPDQILMVASDVTTQRAADEARLAAAIAQREMLIKEVHHRIKNNLQGVAGLLQQSASRHPEAAGAIAEAVSQVHAIAQVHGLQVGVTGPMRVRGVVEAIAASVQRMFGRAIHVEVHGPAPHRFALTEADSIPIALTVNELLTNAIKHSAAAVGEAGGDIRCRLDCGEAAIAIAIANRGALAPGFSLAGVPAGVSGLGLVRSLLPRKGARMTLEADGPDVVARLELAPPAVTVLEPL
jgi:PAS domain S-box-containing protein